MNTDKIRYKERLFMNELKIYDDFKTGVTVQTNEQLESYETNLKSAIRSKRDAIRKINFCNFGAKVSFKQLQDIQYDGSRDILKYVTTFEDEDKKDIVKYGLNPIYDMELLDFWSNPSLVSLDLSNEELQKLNTSLDIANKALKEYKGDIKTFEALQKVQKVFKKVQHLKLDQLKLDFVQAALTVRNEPAAIAAKARLDAIHVKRDKLHMMRFDAIPTQAQKEEAELDKLHKAVKDAKASAAIETAPL